MQSVDDRPPDPTGVLSPREFLEVLLRLRFWAGQPSLRRLRQLGGTTIDGSGRSIDALPQATVSYLLRGDNLPRAEFVRAFVTACLRARSRSPQEIYKQVERWHAAWLKVADGTHPRSRPSPVVDGPAPSCPVPRQLPPDIAGYTGRTDQFAALDETLAEARRSPDTMRLIAIEGIAGVGKTALAVRWAHRVAEDFPDGQLWVNLRGYARGAPLRPAQVLSRFFRVLGYPTEDVPTELDEAAAIYRSLLADTHILVVLDNAADAEQVRPLLSTGASFVVVTSRNQLIGLNAFDGARRLLLEVLPLDEARMLLTQLLGPDRADTDPEVVASLCRASGYLPLALRAVAAKLAAAPHRLPADFLAELENDPLSALTIPGDRRAGVSTSFDLSYSRLPEPAQRAFRILGLLPGRDFSVVVAAAAMGEPVAEARMILTELTGRHLLMEVNPGRYKFHNLLRAHAFDRALQEESAFGRRRVLARVYGHAVASAADVSMYPQMLQPPLRFDSSPPEDLADVASAEPPEVVMQSWVEPPAPVVTVQRAVAAVAAAWQRAKWITK